MKISYLLVVLLLSTLGIKQNDKSAESDLVVLKIETPEWQHEENRTKVKVTIQNKGKEKSLASRAMLYDLDLSVAQGKTLGLEKVNLDLLAESNGRASYRENEEYNAVDAHKYDYDPDFAVFEVIPVLKPKEKLVLTFYINDIWVYNSNCELRVILDIDKTNNESNRDNNQMDFFGWG